MALSPQLLVTGLIVGGVGIGVPVYLVTAKNTFNNSLELIQFISEVTGGDSKAFESTQEMKCGVLGNVATTQVSRDFLKEQEQDETLYSLASCASTDVVSENIFPLGKSWDALFPKDVLKKIFSNEGEGQFPINFKTILGDKNSKNFVTSTIINSTNESFINVRWVDVLDSKHLDSRKVIVTTIEGSDQKQNQIYLILNSKNKIPDFTSK